MIGYDIYDLDRDGDGIGCDTSRIERDDLDRAEIATVRSYVEALGGEVEIIARFGDERITVG